ELLRILAGPVDGVRILESRLSAQLEALPERLQEGAAPVRQVIAAVGTAVAAIRAQPQSGPIQARILLKKTANLLSATLLLAIAGDSLAKGDARPAHVARRYIDRRF